jgi:lipid-binding SYLF domain-containing protein
MKTQKREFTMKRTIQIPIVLLLVAFALTCTRISQAATVGEINHDVDGALQSLYQTAPAAKNLAEVAKGILVFPNIIKGGLGIGGQYGEGALRENGKTTGYYRTMSASYGLQAGVQTFGYALFFTDDESLAYLKKSKGWELGVGPSLVVVDKGAATSLTTSTLKAGIYAFIFKQKGLMAGIGIQGSKITKITPEN